jgi:hypothetical protein
MRGFELGEERGWSFFANNRKDFLMSSAVADRGTAKDS